MFKSTEEYDSAIYNALVYIRDNNSYPKTTDELDQTDLGDVMNLCNMRGYIDGIDVHKNIAGHYMCTGTPRLTYSGLNFIEQFNQ